MKPKIKTLITKNFPLVKEDEQLRGKDLLFNFYDILPAEEKKEKKKRIGLGLQILSAFEQ